MLFEKLARPVLGRLGCCFDRDVDVEPGRELGDDTGILCAGIGLCPATNFLFGHIKLFRPALHARAFILDWYRIEAVLADLEAQSRDIGLRRFGRATLQWRFFDDPLEAESQNRTGAVSYRSSFLIERVIVPNAGKSLETLSHVRLPKRSERCGCPFTAPQFFVV